MMGWDASTDGAKAPVGSLVVDGEGRVAWADPSLTRGIGRLSDELLGALFFDPERGIGGLDELAATFRDATGEPDPDRLYRATPLTVTGEALEPVDIRLRPFEAGPARMWLITIWPVEDGDGRLADLEHRLAEVARVRHEINNQLMGLIGNAELLMEGTALNPHARTKVHSLFEQSRRVLEQVRALGKFTER